MQGTATRTLAKPDVGAIPGSRLLGHDLARRPRLPRQRLRVLVLGAQVWVIGVAWPLIYANGEKRAAQLWLAGAGLVALLVGALAADPSGQRAQRWLRLRPVAWLIAFPALLAVSCALRSERWNQQHYGTALSLLLWLALLAYGAEAAKACAGAAAEVVSRSEPLEPAASDRALQAGMDLRTWVLVTVCFAGAIGLALIAPRWGGMRALELAWGDAALTGGVLTAVIGGALGVTTVAVFLAQGLREGAGSPLHSRRELMFRSLGYLALAVLGAITYVASRGGL
jgi:hypothetical protein